MRPILLIYMAFFLFACTESPEALKKASAVPEISEQQKRKYFVDNNLGLYENDKSFLEFFDAYYPEIKAVNRNNPYPYAFEEEYIDTTKIDSARHWMRIIVEPCFRWPYSLIVEKSDKHYNFTVKLTNGDCSHTGSLFLTMKPFLFDSIGNDLFAKLDSLGYWTMQPEKNGNWLDGETWTYEAMSGGRYNLVRQRLPQFCKNKDALVLYNAARYLIKIAKLDEVLVALGQPTTSLKKLGSR